MKSKAKKHTKTMLLVLVTFTLVITSCNKSEVIPQQDLVSSIIEDNNYSIEDETYATDVFEETIDIGDEAVEYFEANSSMLKNGSKHRFNRLNECATVTREVIDSIFTVTIDFGENNCLGNDGRERRGKIIMTHYGNYWSDTCQIRHSYENYYVDDNQIIGERNVLRYRNQDSTIVSNIVAEESIIFADTSGTMTITAEHIRTVIEGYNTRTRRDDVYELIGQTTTVNANGVVCTSTIIEPLIRSNEPECFKYFISGVKQIVKGDESPVIMDYGDGTCDNLVEITKDGVTEVVELSRKRRHRR